MGEKWRHDRAKDFQQQQCRAYRQQLLSANLFSRQPEVLERSFCCEGRTPMHQLVGTYVIVKPTAEGVKIIHDSVEVGAMTDACAAAVRRAIEDEPNCPDMALALVEDASELTPEFHIRLADHSKDDE